jgi:putative inorganic carbon (HCO3(-)) transporter
MLSGLHFGLEGILPLALYLGMFVAFLISVFKKPSVGLYLFVLSLPLQTGRYKLHEFPLGDHFLDILLLGTILGLLLKRLEVIPKTQWKNFFLALAIFYYFSLWEGSFFIDVPVPLWFTDIRFSDWKNYVEMFLLALVVPSVFKEKKEIRNLIIVMCLSVLIVNWSYISLMSGRDLSHFSYEIRDAGPVGYAGVNGLAAFEAMFASFLIGIYATIKRIPVKLGILALLGTSLYCLLYTFSRGGYLGLLVGMLVVGLLRMRSLLVVVTLVVLGWQALLPASVQERITMTTSEADSAKGEQFDSSAQTRIILWEDAIDLFKRNPVTGTGFETYEFMGRVGPYRDTHNYYIKVLAETGFVGIVLYLALLWKLLKSGFDLFYRSMDPFWRAIGLGFLALIFCAIALNFFGDRWTYQQVDGYLWVTLGCVIRGLIIMKEDKNKLEAGGQVEQSQCDVEFVAV